MMHSNWFESFPHIARNGKSCTNCFSVKVTCKKSPQIHFFSTHRIWLILSMNETTQGLDLQSFTLRQLLDLADSLQINCEGVESKADILKLITSQAEKDSNYIKQQSNDDELQISPRSKEESDLKPSQVWRKSKSKSQTEVFNKPIPPVPHSQQSLSEGNLTIGISLTFHSDFSRQKRNASSCLKSYFTQIQLSSHRYRSCQFRYRKSLYGTSSHFLSLISKAYMIDVEDDCGKKKTLLKRYRQLDELNDKVLPWALLLFKFSLD